MTSFDYIILIVLVISLVVGYNKGLLKQLGNLCAIFASIALCRIFVSPISEWMIEHIFTDVGNGTPGLLHNEYVAGILVGIGIFIITFILVKLLFKYLQMTFESLHLSFINRIGGMIFSTFFSFLILSLALNLLQVFKSDGPIVKPGGMCDGKVAVAVLELAPLTIGTVNYWFTQEEVKSDVK